MAKPKELHEGDPCPQCGGELRPALVPTDAQLKAHLDRENPALLSEHYDRANKEQRDELGALHRCADCGYETRFKDGAAGPSSEDEAAGSRRGKSR